MYFSTQRLFGKRVVGEEKMVNKYITTTMLGGRTVA
jgi:hypothetical protein